MPARETKDIPEEHIRKLVRSRLLNTEAVSLEELATFVGQDHESVAEVVDALVADGEIEILRPVGGVISESNWSAGGVVYRMIRTTDRDFLWQKQLKGRPAGDQHQDIKKTWLKMLSHDDDMDLSVVRLLQTMAMSQ